MFVFKGSDGVKKAPKVSNAYSPNLESPLHYLPFNPFFFIIPRCQCFINFTKWPFHMNVTNRNKNQFRALSRHHGFALRQTPKGWKNHYQDCEVVRRQIRQKQNGDAAEFLLGRLSRRYPCRRYGVWTCNFLDRHHPCAH